MKKILLILVTVKRIGYLERQHDVEAADKPFEFFMNRFRLLEAAPRAEFALYTGLPESVIRPQIDDPQLL